MPYPSARFVLDSPCSRAMSGALSVSLYPAGRTLWTSVRDRSTFTGGKTSKPSPGYSNGETMSKKSLLSLIAAALLCSALPALSQNLPEGKGKEIAAAKCNSCHALEARVGNGYTAKGWATAVRMMTNHGVPLSKEEIATLTPYLAKNYPEKNKPDAVVVPGPTKVSMKIFQASTPGARPHDPLAARDGSLWYSGQMANALGRVDPKTGKIKEYPLKTAHSGPHGLDEDKDGNIWYTGNTGALIGKLDPKTGEIKLLTPPTPKARPYGMAVNSKGTVFFVEFGTHKVGSVDPKTLEIREYLLPDPASRPRRIAIPQPAR